MTFNVYCIQENVKEVFKTYQTVRKFHAQSPNVYRMVSLPGREIKS